MNVKNEYKTIATDIKNMLRCSFYNIYIYSIHIEFIHWALVKRSGANVQLQPPVVSIHY